MVNYIASYSLSFVHIHRRAMLNCVYICPFHVHACVCYDLSARSVWFGLAEIGYAVLCCMCDTFINARFIYVYKMQNICMLLLPLLLPLIFSPFFFSRCRCRRPSHAYTSADIQNHHTHVECRMAFSLQSKHIIDIHCIKYWCVSINDIRLLGGGNSVFDLLFSMGPWLNIASKAGERMNARTE